MGPVNQPEVRDAIRQAVKPLTPNQRFPISKPVVVAEELVVG